jgi:DNA polymerase (family 10)
VIGTMDNIELAEIFDRIASLLEIKGELVFKTIAYRRVAESLRMLVEDARVLQASGRLGEIPGVGKAIAQKIDELLDTGQLGFLNRLEEEVPPTLIDLLNIPDVGPKKAALFWKEAGITTLAGLETAAKEGRLKNLPGMGIKSEERILEGILAYRRSTRRYPLPVARSMARPLLKWLAEQPGVTNAQAAGSMRRWKPDIGDLDLVFASDEPRQVMEAFVQRKEVRRVTARGDFKTSVELEDGLRMQLWCQPPERFGALLQFVTGSKGHNVRLREFAQKAGYSLSERGLLDREGKETLCATEEEVYEKLGLPWIPPEIREDRGEVQAAVEGRLPDLIRVEDLVADLHLHTVWSDGEGSIEEMAETAQSLGRKMLAITDHSFLMKVGETSGFEKLERQRAEIIELRKKLGSSFLLLQGTEVDIMADGSLDLPDEILQQMDVVVASLHSSLDQPREVITSRLIKAMHNPYVDIIAHPSGRSLPFFQGADLDWDAVFAEAAVCNVALEINSNPCHLDLDEAHARRAADLGLLLCINTDSHAPRQMRREYGVGVARRAWIESRQVLSTWPVEKILDWLENHRKKG